MVMVTLSSGENELTVLDDDDHYEIYKTKKTQCLRQERVVEEGMFLPTAC